MNRDRPIHTTEILVQTHITIIALLDTFSNIKHLRARNIKHRALLFMQGRSVSTLRIQ